MVLDYFGIHWSEKRIAGFVKTTKTHGTTSANIVSGLNAQGLKTELHWRSNFRNAQKFLDKKMPVIVNWYAVDYEHYSVVVGLDERHIYLLDPEFGNRRQILRTDFKRLWFGKRGADPTFERPVDLAPLIVIYPPDR